MKVLYVIGQNAGGLPHYTAELANAMTEHAEVTVMKPAETTADDLFVDEIELVEAFGSISVSMPNLYNLNVDPVEFVRGLLSYNNLKRVAEIETDVTHITTGLFPQVKLFSWLHRIDELGPLVVTHHEVPSDPFSLSRPPVFVEELINSALPDLDVDGVVVHTENQKRALRRQNRGGDRIEVIPHGAYSVFGDSEDTDVETRPNTVLFFGNVVPPKGLDTLIEAIPLVKRELPDVELLVAGDGRITAGSRAIIDDHPESFEIHNYFVPNEEVKRFFARSEVVALPYREQDGTKGHSGALATAFSFGKPVVSTSAGDFPELVERSGAGVVVPPEDPERLAEALVSVLTDPEASDRMARNSRRMAEELSWESIARRHLDLYREVSRVDVDASPVVQ
ncbi:glycosyltransferase family 4 protein [Halorussus marinus]|uniref:glycosyltransferase family 4 protein n=1 Tax=Halorussus marinus TaxID=2505976 RepID=UPI001092A3A5|nr:glycosyltransferase family 4 protein [Halorussus marinus]